MTEVLGVTFSTMDMNSTITRINRHIEEYNTLFHVVTANPEVVMNAERNPAFKEMLDQVELITPDGIGVVIASKILQTPLAERVTGFDLITGILAHRSDKEQPTTVYALGAKEDVIKLAARNLRQKYPNVEVVGYHHGYFEEGSKEELQIVETISELKPDLLLVGLGSPRQENFIHTYKNTLNAKVAIGCGGTFDILSGTLKRAPESFQRFGIEWLYRLLQQPSRIKRQIVLPFFLYKVLKSRKPTRVDT